MIKTGFFIACLAALFFSCRPEANQGAPGTYLEKVNRAELFITDSMYGDALFMYRSAFSGRDFVLSTDLYNALLCAVRLGEEEEALSYMGQLFAKGMDTSFVFGNPYLSGLVSSVGKPSLMELQASSQGEFDLEYDRQIDSLVEIDQRYARMREEGHITRDSFHVIIYRNTDRLLQLMGKKGFPREGILPVSSPGHSLHGDILFFHYFQALANQSKADGDMYSMSDVLKSATRAGYVKPNRCYGIMMANKIDSIYGGIAYYQVRDSLCKLNFSPACLDRINRNRRDFGDCTMEEFAKKTLYSYNECSGGRLPMGKDEHPVHYIQRMRKSSDRYGFIISHGLTIFLPSHEDFDPVVSSLTRVIH